VFIWIAQEVIKLPASTGIRNIELSAVSTIKVEL